MITVVKTNFGGKILSAASLLHLKQFVKEQIRNLDGDRLIIFKLENGVMGL